MSLARVRKVLKRLLTGLIFILILLAVIVPTWHVYMGEGREAILINYSHPNTTQSHISLTANASLLDVDFDEKKYLIHFVFEPSANMVNAHGQLLYNTTIGFSSLKKFPYSAGDTMMPLQVEFNYDNGDPIDYPFDRYTGYFEIDAFANVWTNVSEPVPNNNVTTNRTVLTKQVIPLSFRLEASMTSFSFTPTFTAFEQHLGLQILTGRSNTTLGFSLFMCLLMWALSLVLAVFGYQVMFRHRPVHAHGCMIGVTMLFALPTLRSAQPGVPENTGCIADVLGYYWNMAIIALETIAILGCWVARWSPNNEKAKGTHEPSKTDSQTTLHKFGHLEHIEHFA